MHFRTAALVLLALICLLPASMAAGSKNDKASITFHIQAQAIDNPKMIFPLDVAGERRFFRRMPEFQTKDFLEFQSFISEDDSLNYGLVLRLKPHAARRLIAVTNVNQGRWLTAMVNGRPVDTLFINRQVDDGVLVIWKNVSLADMSLIENVLPRAQDQQPKP